jgi:uncharacterized repeat protein (TIGR01451 family)
MRVLRASLAALLLVLLLVPATAMAAGLQLTTQYPSVVADPGTSVKFPVVVLTDTPQRVDLTVPTKPADWDVRLQGGGSTIAAVTTAPGSTSSALAGATAAPFTGNFATFTVEVTIPDDAPAGNQQVVIGGQQTDGTTSQLALDINVQTAEEGSVTFTTANPALKGSSSTTFKFSVTLNNDTNQQATFDLSTVGPQGWSITANPSTEANASSVVLDAGSSAVISVSAKAPTDAPAQDYPIALTATGGGQTIDEQLTVTITGSYAMDVATSDQRLNANVTAGGTTTMTFIVTNSGTADLAGVAFTASPPRDWKVVFSDPVNVPANGGQAQVTANITASSQALAGDYVISVTARSADSNATDTLSIRATVDTSSIGLFIGIAIILIVAVGLFFVFQRYGRR